MFSNKLDVIKIKADFLVCKLQIFVFKIKVEEIKK